MRNYEITRLVKSEDLNHHGTLYAGRSVEWLVEAGFIAAASEHGDPRDVLCVKVHGFTFKEPVPPGDIITFRARVVKTGNSSILVYVKATSEISDKAHLDGFLTFACVEPGTQKPKRHGIVLDEPENSEEQEIRQRAAKIAAANL